MPTRDDKVRREARREARRYGYEYRPTTARQAEEAERLNRGLAMLEEHEDEGDGDED